MNRLHEIDVHLTPADAAAALRADARRGLTAHPKELPPKYFYDARGSALFEEITRLPEYYPTRTERALLEESVAEIARASEADTLVELGSGSSAKTRLLLDAFGADGRPPAGSADGRPPAGSADGRLPAGNVDGRPPGGGGRGLRCYVPQDVSEPALRGALDALAADYPRLQLHGVVGDFTRDLDRLPRDGRRLVAFLGGTIGNLRPAERREFLAHVRSVLDPGEQLLLGTGLVTDRETLVAAYDDAAGVTAEFNRNVLRVLNRELGADFDPEAFAHVALWDPENEWIEMRLRAERELRVRVPALDLAVEFTAGEEMRTEISAKFRPEGVRAMLEEAGFRLTHWWTDSQDRFGLSLATAV